MNVSMIGLDLAKSVFQVHGVDGSGAVVVRRQLRRAQVLTFFAGLPRCVVGLEACSTAHHWGRELAALGHEVRLIPPAYVKPYVKRGKSDARDAEAICEAASRPSMRTVALKSRETQGAQTLHKVRERLVAQRTQLGNMLRSHLAEFGIVAPKGREKLAALLAVVADESGEPLPRTARVALRAVASELEALAAQIAGLDREIAALHRSDEESLRLATQPGVGPLLAGAARMHLADPAHYRSARDFSASLGLTPRFSGTGGKVRAGRITKMGDGYLRRLLVMGATSRLALAMRRRSGSDYEWFTRMQARRPIRVVITALANKMARTLYAMARSGEPYRTTAA